MNINPSIDNNNVNGQLNQSTMNMSNMNNMFMGNGNNKLDPTQLLNLSNQINFLTQQLALKQQQIDSLMKKPKILNQNDKSFMRKPNLK